MSFLRFTGKRFLFIAVGVLLTVSIAQAQQATPATPALRLNEAASLEAETVQACDATVTVGSQTHFASSVGNGGQNTLPGTMLTLTATAQLVFVPGTEQSSRGVWTVQPQQAVLTIGNLAPGEVVTWQIDLEAVAPGTATFTEVFTSSNGGRAEASCTLTVVGGEPSIIVTKTASAATVPIGTEFQYQILVDNVGTAAAENVTMDDTLPATVLLVQATTTQGTCTFNTSAHQVLCDFGTIPDGGGLTVTIRVLADGVGDASNTAFVGEQSAFVGVEIMGQGGTLRGRTWRDANADGVLNTGEEGVGGVTIFLDDNGNGQPDGDEATTSTDAEGNYTFMDVQPGFYNVRQVVPEGSFQTFPEAGAHFVELTDGAEISGLDFGHALLRGAIHGYKFFDVDQDGRYDFEQGDRRLNGIRVQIFDQAGSLVAEQMTHGMDINEDGFVDPLTEQGLFWFENLPLGLYRVVEVVPEGWEQTFPVDNDGAHLVELTPGNPGPILIFGNFGPVLEDWGDLPDPLFNPVPSRCVFGFFLVCYNTVFPLGPTHFFSPFDPNPLRLGTHIDPELDGEPDLTALGDDENPIGGLDDEDGVGTIVYKGDGTGEVEITVNGPAGFPAFLDAWIDFNEDGFLALSEQIFVGVPVPVPSTATYTFSIPPGEGGGTFARFRISPVPFGLFPTGVVFGGEVEDYALLGVDYGDAREDNLEDFPDFPQRYPVLPASNGARHAVSLEVRLGARVDHDGTGPEPSILASGDDKAFDDDEDGIDFTRGFFERTIELDAAVPDPAAGQPFTFHALARGTTVELVPAPSVDGRLDAWVDFNRDGDWDDEGEQVFANEDIQPVSGAPTDTLRFDVPVDADLGYTYSRFRFSRNGNLNPTGAAPDGEVEDYLLQLLNTVTQVQVVNAVVPGGRAAAKQDALFDLYVDGTRIADDLATHTATAFLTLPLADAAPVIEVVSGEASDNRAPLFSSEVDFAIEGTTVADANTLVLTGTEGGPLGLLLKTEARPIAANADKVEFFIAHAASGEQALDVRLLDGTGTVLADDLPYGATTAYVSLDPGPYTFEVAAGDGSTQPDAFRLDLSAYPGQSLVLVLAGQRSDGSLALTAFDAESNRLAPEVVTATEEVGEVPAAFALHGNYPNPFNPQTTIRFDVAEAAQVRLTVFDALGRAVATLVDEPLLPGTHEAVFDARNLPSGSYFYRLEAGTYSQARPMMLLK